ncbi:MAG: hypothetical protein KatS3mg104_0768 [Phycisphaerae bacterium]|nr:MAG: hypothetical protein KatS3mg104_0768 [Phycisphaerae bacterium]
MGLLVGTIITILGLGLMMMDNGKSELANQVALILMPGVMPAFVAMYLAWSAGDSWAGLAYIATLWTVNVGAYVFLFVIGSKLVSKVRHAATTS